MSLPKNFRFSLLNHFAVSHPNHCEIFLKRGVYNNDENGSAQDGSRSEQGWRSPPYAATTTSLPFFFYPWLKF